MYEKSYKSEQSEPPAAEFVQYFIIADHPFIFSTAFQAKGIPGPARPNGEILRQLKGHSDDEEELIQQTVHLGTAMMGDAIQLHEGAVLHGECSVQHVRQGDVVKVISEIGPEHEASAEEDGGLTSAGSI